MPKSGGNMAPRGDDTLGDNTPGSENGNILGNMTIMVTAIIETALSGESLYANLNFDGNGLVLI